jgi:UDP-N-acetyl-D-mannosaminuronic acid dehydrogenase
VSSPQVRKPQKVAVLGIGRVGLPLALYLADRGHQVSGVDINSATVAVLEGGNMPFMERGAPEVLERTLGKGFRPTTDAGAVSDVDVIILTLGTPVDDHLNPDFSALESVLSDIGPRLRKGQLFILRSTVTPGTTEFVRRWLEKSTALVVGTDLYLAFCPERIAQGHSFSELPEIPQIVGSLDDASGEKAAEFFEGLSGPILRTDARSSEIAKLFCNVYRYIDFAIGNEFMMLADQHGRNIYEILRLVNEGYKRGGVKQPGFAGGPCLYKDGFFLVESTPFPDLLTTAWKINESLPSYLINRARTELGTLEGKKVLIMGLAFKRDMDDSRNSLSYKAIKILRRQSAEVLLHDPYLAPGDLAPMLTAADLVIVATNHTEYLELGLDGLKDVGSTLISDVWNVFGTDKIFFRVPEGIPSG